uniref:Uncharacterized protein n=1 Tax=Salvator merianae TaxID=96440 RepID=A0A8D0B0P9_SALMN
GLSPFSSTISMLPFSCIGSWHDCIKTIKVEKKPGKGAAKIHIAGDVAYVQVDQDGGTHRLEKAKITLDECWLVAITSYPQRVA